jgi:hypothetical protein
MSYYKLKKPLSDFDLKGHKGSVIAFVKRT